MNSKSYAKLEWKGSRDQIRKGLGLSLTGVQNLSLYSVSNVESLKVYEQ